MAHDGTGTGWDETAPADSDFVPAGPTEIRDLRKRVRIMNNKEHVAAAVTSAGGEHKAGSAKAYYTGSTPAQRPDAATALGADDAGRLWVNSATISVWSGSAWVTLNSSGTTVPTAVLYDSKASGSSGGSFTSGSWVKRTLQTESDPSGIVTLASDQFTLAAGTYHICASAPAHKVNGHRIRLQNVTDNTTAGLGSVAYSGSGGDYATTESSINIVFTIASSKTFELQHRCETTNALSNGRGRATTFSVNEIYTQVSITKLS